VSEQQQLLDFPGSPAQRLDIFLASRLPEFSRSRLQSLIKDGMVIVGDKPAVKSGQILDHPVKVIVQLPRPIPSDLTPEAIPLDILFEDGEVLIINKPAGMVVHPAAGHDSGTLVHAALGHAPQIEGIGGVQRPGVVHRLDKDTSGIIVLAKNERAHRWLQDQFRLRKVEKIYLALVDGQPPTPSGRVEAPIGRDGKQRKQMAVVSEAKGRSAESEYHTLESFPRHTLLEVHPITGRTHQIRLHLAFIGCPIVGDTIYGHRHPSLPLQRHFLHAYRLSLCLPGESAARTIIAPLPVELEELLISLRHP
jgi:23S rRNA pseudouridine1911/1915/1917 synthase